jgi:nucleoside-diphosphate-sugar epimerase
MVTDLINHDSPVMISVTRSISTFTKPKMHVLVTGAAGLIGSHAMLALLEEGHSILATDINPLPAKVVEDSAPYSERVTQLIGDLTDIKFVDELFDSSAMAIEGIMHIGGIRSPVGLDPRIVHNINVVASYNVLQTAAARGVTRIVQASSCNALGLSWTMPEHWNLDFVPVNESHPMKPVSAFKTDLIWI